MEQDTKLCASAAGMAVSSLLMNETHYFDEDDDLPGHLISGSKVPKVVGFVENTVLHYADIDFRSHFRLRRSDVEVLCS